VINAIVDALRPLGVTDLAMPAYARARVAGDARRARLNTPRRPGYPTAWCCRPAGAKLVLEAYAASTLRTADPRGRLRR